MTPHFKYGQVVLIGILILLSIITLLPFYMTVMMSQKTNAEIINHFWALPTEFRPDYFADAFQFIYRYIYNSILVALVAVTGTVLISSLSGYVFARIEFRGKETLFMLILSLMMIPGLLTLIPAFLWYKQFPGVGGNDLFGVGGHGFLDTRWVLIIAFVSGGQIFGIFLCRTFFESLPPSLFEAARIDGASEFQAYWNIAVPLSLPILATLAVLNFVGIYNDYIWPLVTVGNDSIQVFAVGVTKFGAEGNLDYGPVMAGYLIGAVPLILVFVLGMKYYIEGLTQGAVKG